MKAVITIEKLHNASELVKILIDSGFKVVVYPSNFIKPNKTEIKSYLIEIECPLPPSIDTREENDEYDTGWNDCIRVLNGDFNVCKLG